MMPARSRATRLQSGRNGGIWKRHRGRPTVFAGSAERSVTSNFWEAKRWCMSTWKISKPPLVAKLEPARARRLRIGGAVSLSVERERVLYFDLAGKRIRISRLAATPGAEMSVHG